METILGILGSVFTGGATGVLGVVVQRWADYKNRQIDLQIAKQQGEFELAKLKADAEISAQEWAGRTKVAATEADAAKDVAESQAFATSLQKEPERYSNVGSVTPMQNWLLVLLDVLRGAVRPMLTLYLCVLTTYIWWQVRQELSTEDLDANSVIAVWTKVVDTILYLFTTTTLWYFGTRNRQAPPKLRQ